MKITWIGSPNYSRGRGGKKIIGFIIHWIVGNLASADATFQNQARQTSAHYGVEDDKVHQYVKNSDTAWHSGHWGTNQSTIGIEHSAAPGRKASKKTYETSAQLMASIIKKENVGNKLTPHGAIVATQCPGTVDVNRLAKRVNEILGGEVVKPVPAPPKPTEPVPVNEWVTVNVDVLFVRKSPTTAAPLAGSMRLYKGNKFQIVGRVKGQMVNGISTWVKSSKGNYVWAGGLKGYTTPASKPKKTSRRGTVTVTTPYGLYVRERPTSQSPLAGSRLLSPGVQVQYVGVVRGQNVNGNNLWLKSIYGNYFWAGGTNYK